MDNFSSYICHCHPLLLVTQNPVLDQSIHNNTLFVFLFQFWVYREAVGRVCLSDGWSVGMSVCLQLMAIAKRYPATGKSGKRE